MPQLIYIKPQPPDKKSATIDYQIREINGQTIRFGFDEEGKIVSKTVLGTEQKKAEAGTGAGKYDYVDLLNNKKVMMDTTYRDLYDNVENSQYFDILQELYAKALSDPTVKTGEKADIVTKMFALQKERQEWEITQNPKFNDVLDTVKGDVENEWVNTWQNRSFLTSEIMVENMAEVMETSLQNIKAEYTDLYSRVSKETKDEKTLQTIKGIIDYVENQEIFYRGVITKPTQYGLTIDSDEKGNISKMYLKDINDTKGYNLTDKYINNVRLFVSPNVNQIDKNGNQTVWIGRNAFAFKGASEKGVSSGEILRFDETLSNARDFDNTSLQFSQLYNYASGTLFETPYKSYYLMNDDGSFRAFIDSGSVRDYGLNPSNSKSITVEDDRKIRKMYQIYKTPPRSAPMRAEPTPMFFQEDKVQSGVDSTVNSMTSAFQSRPPETEKMPPGFVPFKSKKSKEPLSKQTDTGFISLKRIGEGIKRGVKKLFTPPIMKYKDTEKIKKGKF